MQHRPAVWIDFENAPHVWVLSSIIKHFQKKEYPVIFTARDFSCTVGLCRRMGFEARIVGIRGSAQGRISKAWRILDRAVRLSALIWRMRKSIGLALSHGSRSQALTAHYLGIPIVSMDDYELSDQSFVRFVDHLLVPFVISKDVWGPYADRVCHYPGVKEELYLCNFKPAEVEMHSKADKIKVFFRPEGRFAHYRSDQGEAMQHAILQYISEHPNIFMVLSPRDAEQAKWLIDFCEQRKLSHWLPGEVVDGPALIWQVDLVIGGGGTMTREAAVLGVPSYSFFAGKWGAVDHYLQAQGRLVRLADLEDIRRIRLKQRERVAISVPDTALNFVTGFVEGIIGKQRG